MAGCKAIPVDLLDKLRAEGQLESQGRFSLDLARRQEKLVFLQRQEPWLFLWKFLQAAVRSQAGSFSIEARADFTGLQFEPVEAVSEDFVAGLLHGDRLQSPWLRHLSLGVVLAMASEGRGHRLIYDDGRQRQLLSEDGSRQQGPSQGRLVRLEIRGYPVRWWKAWQNPPQLKRLARDLPRRAGLAPLKILLNGESQPLCPSEKMFGLAPQRAEASWTERSLSTLDWICESLYLDADGLAWPSSCGRSCRHNQLEAEGSTTLGTRWLPQAELTVLSGAGRHQQGNMAAALRESKALLLNASILDYLEDEYVATRWQLVAMVGGLAFAAARPGGSVDSSELKPYVVGTRLSGVAQLPILPRGTARLLPYWDGICLDAQEVAGGPPGALAILDRADWQVDVGQLQALSNPEAQRWAVQAWADQVEWLKGFIFSQSECESRRLPMDVRLSWRQFLSRG